MSVTPKIHALLVHVPQFLEKYRHLGFGLGFYSEQASEAVHCDFDSLWTGNKYKRSMSHDEYTRQLFKTVVTYNSRHQ